ncbi:MAG: hypothetical protein ABIO85_06170 [Sphingomicrobium sp.]
MVAGCNRRDPDTVGRLQLAAETEQGRSPFGPGFDKASHASAFSEPMNVVDGDLAPVDPRKEPIAIE